MSRVGPENRVIAILGCTASGKGVAACTLASRIDAEIVSVDSMKIYRRMDIGTAKPSAEQRAAIPHHLIDLVEPWESFSAARFVEMADAAVEAAHSRGRPVVTVGGSVLYFKCFYEGMFSGPSADPDFRAQLRERAEREGLCALHDELRQVDPQAAMRIHRNDMRRIERALEVYHLTGKPISNLQKQWDQIAIRRPDWQWTLVGLRREKEVSARRINDRIRKMLSAGLVDEARALWTNERGISAQASQAVGYAELYEHFAGRLSLDEAVEKIKINTRRLAKQQRTWLKRLSGVTWFDLGADDNAGQLDAISRYVIGREADPTPPQM